MKYSTYAWDLEQALDSGWCASCKTLATLNILSAQTIKQEKAKNLEKVSNPQQIESYCLVLDIQNPWLREVDLESKSKGVSDKINMLTQERKTTIHLER